jgi:hypothetical protein
MSTKYYATQRAGWVGETDITWGEANSNSMPPNQICKQSRVTNLLLNKHCTLACFASLSVTNDKVFVKVCLHWQHLLVIMPATVTRHFFPLPHWAAQHKPYLHWQNLVQ